MVTDDDIRETEQPESHGDDTSPERGIPSVSGKKKPPVVVLIVLVVFVCGILLANIFFSGGNSQEKGMVVKEELPAVAEAERHTGRAIADLELPPPPKPKPKPKPEPKPEPAADPVKPVVLQPPRPPAPSGRRSKEESPEQRKMNHGLLAAGNGGSSDGANGNQQSNPYDSLVKALESGNGAGDLASASLYGQQGEQDKFGRKSLGDNLKATVMKPTAASLIQRPTFTLTKGHFLDCALETAISSDLSGQVSCRLTRDVYSTDGKLVLLDAGSRLVGEYQGGMKSGQARIFVLWQRVETPEGVVVGLDSPGTDALGRTGADGFINTHFWKRFGGAIMLSIIDDVGNYATSKAGGDGDNINFGSTSQAASDGVSIVLENSINIPPTLEKNHGDHVNIFVARDLDFSTVYSLSEGYR